MPEQFRERSLLPVDVGFDLRNTGHSVRIYEGFSYRYLDQNNNKAYVYPEADAGTIGNLVAIAEYLAHAGYCVTAFKTPVGHDVVVVSSGIREEGRKIVWVVPVSDTASEAFKKDGVNYGECWRAPPCHGDTLQEALINSGWELDDLEPLSSDEY